MDEFAATGRGDIVPIQGVEHRWHLRVGDQRVIFTYDLEPRTVLIIRVLPRGRAYRGLG